MKKLTNKNFIQKIVIAIVIVTSFNFVVPTVSSADFGGVLLGPVIDLVAGIFDSGMALLQVFMDGGEMDLLKSEGFLVKSTDFDASTYNMAPDSSSQDTETIKADDLDQGWFGWGTYYIPIIKYSPEKIFANEVPGLDANFINPKQWSEQGQNDKSIALKLQETIASWYKALRNLVIVGLLSVLLYVGIRIVISSVTDKAKYKQMLMDWVVALCLVFFLHYIMSFTMTFVDLITEGIGGYSSVIVSIDDGVSFKTNLTGYCRMQVQYKDFGTRMIYLIFYIALVIYTFKFTWSYMRRAITMAFLTLIAPLVTLTYPIDKMGDGKSQAFGAWLKEYIFNALLQPFHLIIYSIFLGSAMDLVVANPLYAILFLAFITPAENILRKFFGFDKASTAGASFAGGFGGAAAFKMMSNAMNKIGKGGKGNSNGGGDKGIRQQKTPIENPDSPSGVDGFTNRSLAGASQDGANEGSSPNSENPTAQQRMVEAYDENNYGTNEYDSAEREVMAREAYEPEGMNYTAEEYANILRDSGYDESEIADQVREKYGNPEQSTQHTETRGERIKRGIKNKATSIYKDKLSNKRWWGQNGIKAAKFAGRTAVRTLTAGTIGAVGLGMGIAGDNLEDVITYGVAGTSLGATVGGNIALKGINKVASGVSSQVRDVWHGSHEEAQLARQRKEKINDASFISKVQENYRDSNGEMLHGNELNQAVDRAADYYNEGITDTKQITKTMKLEDKIMKDLENQNWPEEQRNELAKERATTISKLASKVDDNYLRKPENVDNLKNSLSKGIQAKGLNKREADNNANEMIRELKMMKKVD